ncbi:hypothetical protein XELAEV_18008510mg [Xenopus laevis]|uniref:Uncharacterized protein n=1 Tax=Xenopus laevis TaxID=8355 RepID=A0A974E4R6_XENLA|nr:hypothetical protein XELAEV_18008510mg [Xenopus laevis]
MLECSIKGEANPNTHIKDIVCIPVAGLSSYTIHMFLTLLADNTLQILNTNTSAPNPSQQGLSPSSVPFQCRYPRRVLSVSHYFHTSPAMQSAAAHFSTLFLGVVATLAHSRGSGDSV